MKKRLITWATLAAALTVPQMATAGEPGTKQAGDFMVHVRAIAVVPDGGGTTRQIGGDIEVDNSFAPEIDFTYMVTKNIGVELIAAITKHQVDLENTDLGGADVDLGHVRVIPPTLLLQYHFLTDEMISPYIGVGVNYTFFFDESDGPTVSDVRIDNAWGYAFQAGFDFQPKYSNFVFNVDLKRLFISPQVSAHAGATEVRSRNFDLDPWIAGVGFGYKF